MLATDALNYLGNYIYSIFLNPGSLFYIGTFVTALAIAAIHFVRRRMRRGRAVRARTILAALFPAKILRHRSMRADIFMFFINTLLTGLLIGWAIIGVATVSTHVHDGLAHLFGLRTPASWAEWQARALATVLFFFAYEFGFWLDHYLKHRVRILWEFHKVHHAAEHLTPLTLFRMHPIDSLIFTNILAVTIGATAGAYAWAMGGKVESYTVNGTNIILMLFVCLYIHLQHSELWISFTGWWGKIFMSPAHHQIHHSRSARHFDKNMGGCLSLFDWLFGTLYVPGKTPEKLRFGVQQKGRDPHEMGEALLGPLRDAAAHVLPKRSGQITPGE